MGDPVDGSFLDIGVMDCMRRQMHQRGFSAARYERQTRGGRVSDENIRALNDAFRTAMTGGRVFMTAGVDALSSGVKAMVIRAHLHGVHWMRPVLGLQGCREYPRG